MALAAWQGIDEGRAADIVEIGGMKRAAAALVGAGFGYDEPNKRWVGMMAVHATARAYA